MFETLGKHAPAGRNAIAGRNHWETIAERIVDCSAKGTKKQIHLLNE
jgi:hypothetical protein